MSDSKEFPLSSKTIVADLLKRWPQTIPVFFKLRTSCVGCDMAPFDTLTDVAENYLIPLDHLLAELQKVIDGS